MSKIEKMGQFWAQDQYSLIVLEICSLGFSEIKTDGRDWQKIVLDLEEKFIS